jgi:hypothetical protein
MGQIDITKPLQPRSLTGITHNPVTNEPMVQMQIMGTIPFKFLMEKADVENLKKIASMAIAELQRRGERW